VRVRSESEPRAMRYCVPSLPLPSLTQTCLLLASLSPVAATTLPSSNPLSLSLSSHSTGGGMAFADNRWMEADRSEHVEKLCVAAWLHVLKDELRFD